MLSRPKPGESEEDLLKFQSQFLAAGTSAAVKVVKKADKRKGGEVTRQETGAEGRDVVNLQDYPEVPPILTPGPSKKSKVSGTRVHFADEDPEDLLEKHDHHITAVISKIIERDTSTATITAPVPTGEPFPRVFHRSEIPSVAMPGSGKVSIFAQKMAAKRVAEAAKRAESTSVHPQSEHILSPMSVPPTIESKSSNLKGKEMTDGSCIVTGEGLRSSTGPEEAQRIHEENVNKLKALSTEEIILEQERIFSQLDPKLVTFLRSKRKNPATQMDSRTIKPAADAQPASLLSPGSPAQATSSLEILDKEEENQMSLSVDDLPVKPQKEWVHMNTVEFEKLEWTKDLPQTRQKKTKKGMQARFSLKGDLIPPHEEIPTHMGLHHHGDEAERAGYSLQELFHLSRSQFIQQRTLSLQVLGRIVKKAKQGEFASVLKGSVLRLLLDAGFLFLLRFSIDDPADNVIAASVTALYSLLVSAEDQEYLDMTFNWYQGTKTFPFLPIQEEEDDDDDDEEDAQVSNKQAEKEYKQKSKEDKKPDPEVARYDAIKGLLKTKFLHRLRYILEVVRPPPPVVLHILEILTRVAHHSVMACSQLMDCPRLIETIIREFLPMQWSIPMETGDQAPASIHGVPCSAAMKFLRVLASSSRHTTARLLHTFDMKSRLGRFVVQEPQDLPLLREEAEGLITETFRFWAIAAGYGQACDLYRELYPAVIRILQSLSGIITACKSSDSPAALSIQRAAAVITLLTHVTQTAACTAELETQLHSTSVDSEPQIPPPPVSWDNVAGLQPIVEGILKGCLKEVLHASTWDLLQPLTITSINFLASYYQAASRQPSLNTVLCNEEVENLTENVLLPLLDHPSIQSTWDLLRSCSAVCNTLTCSPLPESVNSIVTLSCAGGKPQLSVPGKKSPFPLLTALLNLVCRITSVHKGLVSKFSFILEYKGLQLYLIKLTESPTPAVTPSSNWLLRHEYHFQYFLLSLQYKAASMSQSQHAPLFHSVALTVLSRLLPGSEHLAHKIFTTFAFNPVFMPEGSAGGPQAADLSDILHITSEGKPAPPGSAALSSFSPSRGVLLEQTFKDLPSIQSCYLTHFAHMEQALSRSKMAYQERTCFIQSAMLPEAKGPILPSDWPFLPLISLYNKVTNAEMKGKIVNSLSSDLVNTVTRNLQWILLLESWRAGCLQGIPTAAKLARLACVFLTGGDLFLEAPVHAYTAALTVMYSQPKYMESLKLDVPLPGLTSFYDFYMDLLEQFEGVSFGDPLFGTFILLPLQRRFSVQLRQAVFGEHISSLRSLSVPLNEFPIPLTLYTSPPEDNLNLLRLYFRTLVTGALRQMWCPVLYVVALAHVNSFIFSQDHVAEEVDTARKSMLRKANLLVDEGLRKHLLYFKQPSSSSPMGFEMYDELPPLRQKHLKLVTERQEMKMAS